MRHANIKNLSDSQLVSLYVDVATEQDRAALVGDTGQVNRLFDTVIAVEEELKGRAGDQRRLLVSLYDHSDMQVRLNAARATLAVEPEKARETLRSIRSSGQLPQSLEAGMSLRSFDDGTYKPT